MAAVRGPYRGSYDGRAGIPGPAAASQPPNPRPVRRAGAAPRRHHHPPPAPASPPPPAYGITAARPATPPPPPPAPGYSAMPPAGYAAAPDVNLPFAPWGRRVVAALIDYVVPGIIANVIGRASSALGLLLSPAGAGLDHLQQGDRGPDRTVVRQEDRRRSPAPPPPPTRPTRLGHHVRWIAHILDALPCLSATSGRCGTPRTRLSPKKSPGTYFFKSFSPPTHYPPPSLHHTPPLASI